MLSEKLREMRELRRPDPTGTGDECRAVFTGCADRAGP